MLTKYKLNVSSDCREMKLSVLLWKSSGILLLFYSKRSVFNGTVSHDMIFFFKLQNILTLNCVKTHINTRIIKAWTCPC